MQLKVLLTKNPEKTGSKILFICLFTISKMKFLFLKAAKKYEFQFFYPIWFCLLEIVLFTKHKDFKFMMKQKKKAFIFGRRFIFLQKLNF